MKTKFSIKKTIALLLSIALIASIICVNAFAAATDDELAAIDAVMFTSGSRGSAESTGIIGGNGWINVNYLDKIDNSVTWELKNGVLTFSGAGPMVFNSNDGTRTPFSGNEYIKTAIFEKGITVVSSILCQLPNLTTIIIMDNATKVGNTGIALDCPNLKTVIYGANLQNNTITTILPDNNTRYASILGNRDSANRITTNRVSVQNLVILSSEYGDLNTLAAEAKAALADAYLPAEVLAKLPKELGGTAGEVKTDPLQGLTVSEWAKPTVTNAFEANIIPADTLGTNYTKAITRAQFCAIATKLYETITGKTLTASGSFNDTNDVNVLKMASIGVVNGYGNGLFGPNDSLTRAQAATILTRLSEVLGKTMTEGNPQFTDIAANHWAYTYVNKCYNAGIMIGTSATTFSPEASYTIEQSVVTMVRTMDYVNK